LNLIYSKYSNQYSASGENALIDGLRGGNDFRTGDWQGYYGDNILAEVNFDSIRYLSSFGISAFRDLKSWIFYPSQIEIEVSSDGKTFKKLSPINIKKAESSDVIPQKMEFIIDTYKPSEVKSIRYKITNPGLCPEWHLGKGNKTWMFLDELVFR
jgi:hypothetical protein